MADFDRHFFLYAKGHYAHSEDVISDMKTLISIRSGMGLEFTRPEYAIQVMAPYVLPYIKDRLLEFLDDITPGSNWRCGDIKKQVMDRADFHRAIIYKFLSVLALTKVVDIPFELGVADPEVLPLVDKGIC